MSGFLPHHHSSEDGSIEDSKDGLFASLGLGEGAYGRNGNFETGYSTFTPDEGSSSSKVKRTRVRKPASCEPCRKKKMRCDRLLPCDTCRQRGAQHECIYADGAAPLHVPQINETAGELKAQIDRLQALVDTLSKNATSANTSQLGSSDVSASSVRGAPAHLLNRLNGAMQTPPTSHVNSEVGPPSSIGEPSPIATEFGASGHPLASDGADAAGNKVHLKSLDICEALGQLTVTGVLRMDGQQPHHAPIVSEVKAAMGPVTPPKPSTCLGTFPFPTTPDTIEKIMAMLPSYTQAKTVITCFEKQTWYINFFPWTTFNSQWEQLRTADVNSIDSSFLSVFLAVCGIGLYFLPEKRAMDFPAGPSRLDLVNQWFDASASALTVARFLDSPTLNGIHAMQLLSAWHIYLSPGDSSSTGFAIQNLAAEAVLQLGLHRDPDPALFNPFEANVRRLTFWWTVTVEATAGASLGKTWSLFHLKHCDTALPLDVEENAFTSAGYLRPDRLNTTETNMTSVILRMKTAILSKEITEEAFSIQSVPYETVIKLDAKLRNLEASFNPCYKLKLEGGKMRSPPGTSPIDHLRGLMVNLAVLQEYLRLHRPFVASGTQNANSRSTCLHAARSIIGIFRELAECNYGGLTFKTIGSSCVLCMDLMTFPDSAEAGDLRSDVRDVIMLLERNKDRSKLASNGSSVLNFLLKRADGLVSPPLPSPFAASSTSSGKRVRESNAGTYFPPTQDAAPSEKRHRAVQTAEGSQPSPARSWHSSGSASQPVFSVPSAAPSAYSPSAASNGSERYNPYSGVMPLSASPATRQPAVPLSAPQPPQYVHRNSTHPLEAAILHASTYQQLPPVRQSHSPYVGYDPPQVSPYLQVSPGATPPMPHGSQPQYMNATSADSYDQALHDLINGTHAYTAPMAPAQPTHVVYMPAPASAPAQQTNFVTLSQPIAFPAQGQHQFDMQSFQQFYSSPSSAPADGGSASSTYNAYYQQQ